MIKKRLPILDPRSLIALGVVLGYGAQADTVLDLDVLPTYGGTNVRITHPFGDHVAASSDGITVTGFGTPNIGLAWTASADSGWDYYYADPWTGAAQLDNSYIGSRHSLTFTPNSASASVVVKSFNFHPYYNDSEHIQTYAYTWNLMSGATVLASGTSSFPSQGVKVPVSINYTGTPGQTLKLNLLRTGGVENPNLYASPYDIAADDFTFAQLPEVVQPVGPQVVSVTPADDETGVPAMGIPYLASITNGETTVAAGSIQLRLDGSLVSPPPGISAVGGLTRVSYQTASLVPASSTHWYRLTYADNLGATYTNEVQFTVANYTTLPAAYGLPPGSGLTSGFTYRSVATRPDFAGPLPNSIARAREQLAGTLIDPATGAPFTNYASLGPNSDGSFNIATVLNYSDLGTAGNFLNDELFPGLDVSPYDWFSTEALLHLELAAGYYRFGVNSDDGFEVNALPPQGVAGAPLVLGLYDDARGASDTLFDVAVQRSGIYPFQVIYFEGTGNASCEFFSVTNLATGGKALINDLADSNAVKSYRVLRPRITDITRSGSDVVISWAYGTAPFQVQTRTDLTSGEWTNSGATTTDHTARVPILPGTRFIRVAGQ